MTQAPQPVVPVCYRHPKRETYVRCTRCERSICPECMNEAAVGHQCPECVAEGRRTQRSARTMFGGSLAGQRGYVTITLIAINVIMLIISAASAKGQGLFGGGFGGLLGGSTPLTDWGSVQGLQGMCVGACTGGHAEFFVPTGVANGEYYRLVTQMFLHYGPLHLLMNMWALWILGRQLEAALGPVRFATVYLAAGLGGGVAAYVFSPSSATAGASGAILGLFGALLVVMRRLGRDLSQVIPSLVFIFLLSLAPGISLAGHVGGFLTGGIVAAAIAYAPSKRRNLVVGGTVAVLLIVMALVVVIQTQSLQATPLPPGL
jgi:membrane associated rhomboid family serine protease